MIELTKSSARCCPRLEGTYEWGAGITDRGGIAGAITYVVVSGILGMCIIGGVAVDVKPHKLKQTLADINNMARLPFLVVHYSKSRKRAMIMRRDGGEYIGYYETLPAVERRWPADKIEWILLTAYRS